MKFCLFWDTLSINSNLPSEVLIGGMQALKINDFLNFNNFYISRFVSRRNLLSLKKFYYYTIAGIDELFYPYMKELDVSYVNHPKVLELLLSNKLINFLTRPLKMSFDRAPHTFLSQGVTP